MKSKGQNSAALAVAAAWKDLCHAGHHTAPLQVSPLVTQLFRVSFLGSCHITRLMSTLGFVIKLPASYMATAGHWLTRPYIRTAWPPSSQLLGKQVLPGRRAWKECLGLFPREYIALFCELGKPVQILELLEDLTFDKPPQGERQAYTQRIKGEISRSILNAFKVWLEKKILKISVGIFKNCIQPAFFGLFTSTFISMINILRTRAVY